MVLLNKLVNISFASLLFVSQGFSQITGAQRVCGPATMAPTGPVMPACQFVLPAIIKPLLSASAPRAPEEPADSATTATGNDGDEEDPYDTLLYLLINKILDSKKSQKRSGSCKSGGNDGYADASDASCVGDGGYYPPVLGPYAGADGPGAHF